MPTRRVEVEFPRRSALYHAPDYHTKMLLREVAEVSNAVALLSGRLDKTATLAAALKEMSLEEIDIGVSWLSGVLPQGRIGLGWSTISRALQAGASDHSELGILDVDRSLSRIAKISGAGATRERG